MLLLMLLLLDSSSSAAGTYVVLVTFDVGALYALRATEKLRQVIFMSSYHHHDAPKVHSACVYIRPSTEAPKPTPLS